MPNNVRNLDLNLLVVFEAIYSAGNISSAARTLGVSQPTISNSLARLRESLGDPLFVRAGRGVQPTPKSVQLIEPVRKAMALINDGIADSRSFDQDTDTRHFRIALADMLEPVVMPALVRKLQHNRTVTIEALPIYDKRTPAQRLNDGSLDIVIGPYLADTSDAACQALGVPQTVVAVRKGHPEIQGKLTLEDYERAGHVAVSPEMRANLLVDEVIRRHQIKRHIAYAVTKFWSFPHIIATTDLIGLMPIEFAVEIARIYPIDLYRLPFDMPSAQAYYMTWKNSLSADPSHVWLRAGIEDAFQEIREGIDRRLIL
ncbi:LysR family transcriptional regulator [Stappia sp.]|uniref:LysR family transcriptional regulator n=1 Tax=Stappia sp. TaxID=1870903 RepID=UPI0025D162F7|nr:LysR family transcriptional regulator [Stappia sp.]